MEDATATRTRRDVLAEHLRRLADLVTALPGPDRPEALTDAEVECIAAAVRALDVETSAMIVTRLQGSRTHVPSARTEEIGGAVPLPCQENPVESYSALASMYGADGHPGGRSFLTDSTTI